MLNYYKSKFTFLSLKTFYNVSERHIYKYNTILIYYLYAFCTKNLFLNYRGQHLTNLNEQCPLEGDALMVCDLVGALFRCSHCSPTLTDRLRDVGIYRST